jgi:hypothetical protein
MKSNVGSIDKVVRILIAVVISILFFTGTVQGVVAYVLLALGAIFLLTSAVGFCPLYRLVGISTCKVK